MGIIGWIIFGLVAGALARFLVPGKDPMGLMATFGLGLGGSIVGGLLASVLLDDQAVGLVGSVIGAILLLLGYRFFTRKRAAV